MTSFNAATRCCAPIPCSDARASCSRRSGPELRQYWFLHDKEERPFDRTQRDWVYQTAKGVQNTFGFGTEIEPTPRRTT